MVDEDAQPGADFKSLSGGFGADFAEESEVFSGEVSGNQTDLLWESPILSDEEMRPNQRKRRRNVVVRSFLLTGDASCLSCGCIPLLP
jgi:hypothetical protein